MKCFVKRTAFACFIAMLFSVVGCSLFSPEPGEPVSELPPNLLTNAGFEEVDEDGVPPGPWNPYGQGPGAEHGWASGAVSVSADAARTGSRGLKIQSGEEQNHYVVQRKNVEPGKTYELSAWVRVTEGSQGKIELKVEYLPKGEDRAQWQVEEHGVWQRITLLTTTPDDVTSAGSMLRYHGPGEVHFDDAALRLVE